MVASAATPLMALVGLAQTTQGPNKVVPAPLQLRQGPLEADAAALTGDSRSEVPRKLNSTNLYFSLKLSGVSSAAPGPAEQRAHETPNRPVPVPLQKVHFDAPDEVARHPPLQVGHGAKRK